jgi:YgiT-type zinc finger domain-containing protein
MTGEQESKVKPCPLCNGTLHDQEAATLSFVVKGRVVVVKNAPAEVCDQCGEAFLSTDVSKRVSTIIKDALKHNMELSVVNLAEPITAAA